MIDKLFKAIRNVCRLSRRKKGGWARSTTPVGDDSAKAAPRGKVARQKGVESH